MEIMLHKYRNSTQIKTVDEAIEISRTLSGGDYGLIIIIFDNVQERRTFRKKYKIYNHGEWRFITRTERKPTSSISS